MAAPTFGATSGLSFGAPPQPNQQAGFGFGTPPAATPAPSFGFGSPAAVGTPAPAQGGLSFGAQVAQQPPPLAHSTPGFGLGSPAPQAVQPPLFGNGASGAAGGGGFGGFGAPATTAQQTAGWLGGAQPTGLGAPAIVSTPQQSGFSFGTPTSTPATTQSSISFGLPPTSAAVNFNTPPAQTPGFFSSTTAATPTVGLFSTPKPTFGLTPTTAAPLFGAKTQASAPTPSLGGNLGGEISPPSLIKAVKDNPVPPEMMLLIKNFKSTIKQQKNCSSEVARSSVKPLQKTSEDIESVKHLLVKLERTVNTNRSMNNKLKADTMRCVTDCEMAQRTLELSPGFQSDNIAPIDYFTQRAERFQEQVILLRVEIENTEKHIHSALDPTALSPQELNDSMKRLHECFVALAGRLQLVHSSVSSIKQSHLEIRRKKTNDYTDIFDRKQAALKQKSDLSIPGATLTASSLYSSVAALVQSRITPDQPISSLGQTPSGMPSFGLLQQIPASTSMATPGNVELKSPPGSKRGKR